MAGIAAVLFDLDGTLLDTIGDLAVSMNRALAAGGLPVHEVAAYREFVGEGAVRLAERVLPEGLRGTEAQHELLQRFTADYAGNWDATTAPFPGIDELLAELSRRGIVLAVLSNKPDRYMPAIRARFFSGYQFTHFQGQLPDGPRKPDPAGALRIAGENRIAPEDFIYVGDSDVDMQTARAAGMRACGVLWGYRAEEELRSNGAAHIVARPQEVLALL